MELFRSGTDGAPELTRALIVAGPVEKPDTGNKAITAKEVHDIENRARLRAPVIYEIVRTEGQSDLQRPPISLFWSGLAAGLSLSFSLLTQSLLQRYLPDTQWRILVSDFGYSVGFLMVVLARQQLFTESTITVVLPVLADFTWRNIGLTARMWAIVLAANVLGTFCAALFCSFAPVLSPDIRAAMVEVGAHALRFAWWEMLFRGIAAGFLIAAMVWLIPSSKGSEFHVIVVMTYLIALGSFTHIIAGSVEAFMLVLGGVWTPVHMAWGFFVPVLIGNVIGGTALFALISYAQVMEEM